MEFGRWKSFDQDGQKVIIHFTNQDVILEIIKPEIIHIVVPYSSEEIISKAVEGQKVLPALISVEEKGAVLKIDTISLSIQIRDGFYMEIYKQDGTLLLADYRGRRREREAVDEQLVKILEAEGHDVSGINRADYPIQTIKKLEPEDCFYGLGDKTGFLNKRAYEYENWNSDIPQAHTEDFHALYKSIPFLICKKASAVYGLFFDNTFHSYINLGKESDKYFYYGADGGNLDYYFIGGDSMADVVTNYTYLTGRTPLPQLWTLGHQQSRWGYVSARDIREAALGFRKVRIPCDVMHCDIDYMENYKVFTWNAKDYGKPGELFREMDCMGYKIVLILDPGTKKEPGYFMYEEGMKNDYFVKDKEAEVYVNEVWPGESVFPDFGREAVRNWWAEHEAELVQMGAKGIWNDMNEPASFRGELPEDIVFSDEERITNHKEIHNVYGHFMSKAAYEGLIKAGCDRPFVITRACFAGTQKYSTIWTGDNQSLWSHLQMLIPQLCNLGLSGFAFCGTDVGGFGADCTPELLCRWVEAACFSPLFRNHSSKGSRRQEPWQFGEEVVRIYRKYVELRYRFLPYLYDLFYQGLESGLPVMRPLVLHYEDDPEVYNLNSEFLVGENVLAAPVLEQGATRRMVYLPEGTWYDYWTGEAVEGKLWFVKEAKLEECPIYVKAGSILPTYEVMQYVGERPYQELHLLTTPGDAKYTHFQDNGEDNSYKNGAYNLYEFTKDASGNVTTKLLHEGYERYYSIIVEPIGCYTY